MINRIIANHQYSMVGIFMPKIRRWDMGLLSEILYLIGCIFKIIFGTYAAHKILVNDKEKISTLWYGILFVACLVWG